MLAVMPPDHPEKVNVPRLRVILLDVLQMDYHLHVQIVLSPLIATMDTTPMSLPFKCLDEALGHPNLRGTYVGSVGRVDFERKTDRSLESHQATPLRMAVSSLCF